MKTFSIGMEILDGAENVTVTGDVDRTNVSTLEAVVRAACTIRDGPVVVDMSGVAFADLDSVERLLFIRDAARLEGVEVRLEPVSPPVARVMTFLDLVESLREQPLGDVLQAGTQASPTE